MKSMVQQLAECMVHRYEPRDKRDKLLLNLCPTKNYFDIIKDSVDRNKADPEVRAINLARSE